MESRDLEMITEIVTKAVGKEIKPIKSDIAEMKGDIVELKKDSVEMKKDIVELKKNSVEMKKDIVELKKDSVEMKKGIVELKKDSIEMRKDLMELDENYTELNSNMKAMQLTLENETNKGIQIVAEGHLDLSRKLDAALEVENEKEMLKLRMNRLESDMKKVKEKLEIA